MGALKLITGVLKPQRTRHIDIKYHFTRVVVRRLKWCVKYVPSAKNVADVFTKALTGNKFQEFRDLLVRN